MEFTLRQIRNNNPTWDIIDLFYARLQPADGVAIAGALESNTTLTELNLGRNYLGDVGCAAVADALIRNTTLMTLSLYWNGFREAGSAAVSNMLRRNTTLTTLNLGNNLLGEVDGVNIANALERNTTLTKLDLKGCDVGEVGGLALVGLLETNTTLAKLEFGFNAISKDTIDRIKQLLAGREVPKVYEGPKIKAVVAPIPRGVKRKSSDLHLILL